MKIEGQASVSVGALPPVLISEGSFTSTPVRLNMESLKPPFSISVYPGSGCVCTVKTCNVTGSAANPPASTFWEAWEQGAVSVATTAYINAPIAALEISRVSGSASCSYVVRGPYVSQDGGLSPIVVTKQVTEVHSAGLIANRTAASTAYNGMLYYATDTNEISKVVAGAWVTQTASYVRVADKVSVKSVGATGDGTTDDTTALQCALNIAKLLRKRCFFDSGVYRITSPLYVCGLSNSYESFYIEGEVDTYAPDEAALRGAVLDHTSIVAAPAMFIDKARMAQIKDLAFKGPNSAANDVRYGPFPSETGWVTGGVRDTQYSPQCAIAVDARIGATPSDGGYSGVTYFGNANGGSHFVLFKNLRITQSNVGILVGPCSESTNADDLIFRECSIDACQWGMSFNSLAQNRANSIQGCVIGGCRAGITGIRHGSKKGSIPAIYGVIFGYTNRCFEFNCAYSNAGLISGVYAESIVSIGTWGIGESSGASPIAFDGCTFSFQASGAFAGFGTHFVTFAPAVFNGCTFGSGQTMYSLNVYAPSKPITFNCCTFGISDDPRSQIAPGYAGSRPCVQLNNCQIGGGTRVDIFNGDRQVDVFPTRLRLVNSNARISSYNSKAYRVVTNGTNTTESVGTINSITWGASTVTITLAAAVPHYILVGDLIGARMFAVNGVLLSHALPALRVTSKSGNDVVCEYIVAPSLIDTAGTDAEKSTYVRSFYHHWAPGQSLTGDLTSGNAVITNTNRDGAVKVGDWLKGSAGVPTNARVTAVDDTANTITMSANATATQTGVRLYWGEMQEIGVTGSPI